MDRVVRASLWGLSRLGLGLAVLAPLVLWLSVAGDTSDRPKSRIAPVDRGAVVAGTLEFGSGMSLDVSGGDVAESGPSGAAQPAPPAPAPDRVAVASVIPPGFEALADDDVVFAREDESPVVHIQRFVRGTTDNPAGLASIKIRTVDWPYDHKAELARYEGAQAIRVAGNDAVLYYTVPEAPGDGLTVIRWGLGDSQLIMVTAQGAVTLDEVLAVAVGVVLEVKP